MRSLNRYLVGFIAALSMTATVASAQMTPPKRMPAAKDIEEIDAQLRKHCEAHFPGQTQSLSKASCMLGMILFKESGRTKAMAECTKTSESKSRSERACRLGALIADDIANNRDTFSVRLKLCQAHYPFRIEPDAYLQESCLIGAYLAPEGSLPSGKKPKLSLCEQLSNERTFLGPCAVGLSYAADTAVTTEAPATEQNNACMKYFDSKVFHQGYRGCLNGRAVSLEWNGKASSLSQECSNLTSGKTDTVETAACVVGGSIWHNMTRAPGGENPRFRQCGEGKVSWTEREFLVCLTAAALLDLSATRDARDSCKRIFGGRKNRHRDECYRAVDSLASRPIPPAPTAVAAVKPNDGPKLPPVAQDIEAEADVHLWPEAPDEPEESLEADNAPAADGVATASEGSEPSAESTREPSSETSRTPESEDPATK